MSENERKVLVVVHADGDHRDDDPTSDVIVRSLDSVLSAIGWREAVGSDSIPWIAKRALAQHRCTAVCVLPFDDGMPAHAWLESPDARGWIERPSAGFLDIDLDRLATTIDDALAIGFVGADAVLLGCSNGGLPRLSWGEDWEMVASDERVDSRIDPAGAIGLYAIVDSALAVQRAVGAGISMAQLRIKRPPDADLQWDQRLRKEALSALAAARDAGAELILNDHWRVAAELGIASVHLGQEDIGSLGPAARSEIAASGIRLGISSHSVWELCRARALSTRYIACGPVWPTTTKDMPWLAQGPDNLLWWSRNAGRPVVAIGGILHPQQARIAARSGADGVCLVRALGDDPARVVPAFREAFERGRAERAVAVQRATPWPHPTLPSKR